MEIQESFIIDMIDALADLRKVDASIIKQELADGNEGTMNNLFLLACAARAVA